MRRKQQNENNNTKLTELNICCYQFLTSSARPLPPSPTQRMRKMLFAKKSVDKYNCPFHSPCRQTHTERRKKQKKKKKRNANKRIHIIGLLLNFRSPNGIFKKKRAKRYQGNK